MPSLPPRCGGFTYYLSGIGLAACGGMQSRLAPGAHSAPSSAPASAGLRIPDGIGSVLSHNLWESRDSREWVVVNRNNRIGAVIVALL